MPKFNWQGTNRSGESRNGTLEADNKDQVIERLRAQQITPVKIKKQSTEINLSFGTGVSHQDLLIFTRQLATMIDAGLPLVQCMDILGTQTDNRQFGKVLLSVKGHIETGATFSDSLRKHPKVFDELYVNLIAAGEVGGILDTILNRLSEYIEKSVKLKRQVKSAMVYPIAILGIAMLVLAVMLGKVIPVFEDMYKEFKNAVLPKPTQVVISISNSFTSNWYLYFGGLALFIIFMKLALGNPRGRKIFDAMILKTPIIGTVMRKIVVARFTRTLGTLLSSGVPILDSLDICARTSGNKTVEAAIYYAREKISEGKDLASPLMESGVFPPMVVQMIGVGEQTGAMDQMLQKIADFYEEEVDVAVSAMTSLMEPLMMVFLGGLVGGLIVAMYLPIFEIAGNIQ